MDLGRFDSTGAAEFMEAQKKHVAEAAATEEARAAAANPNYPRILTSGGAEDGTTRYLSEVTLSFDSEAEAQAALDYARANGRHTSQVSDSEDGSYIYHAGDSDWRVSIELDPSRRESTSDHTDGK